MNIKLNETYQTGLLANNDLHAGGVFFSIIYVNCLTFLEDGKVVLSKKVIDAFRPMDPQDLKFLENYRFVGNYYENERGYLVCNFEDIFTTFTGLPTIDNPDVLTFQASDKRLLKQWGEVYALTN